MPKKKGPPYTDIPECKFIVVVSPWGMMQPSKRVQIDYDRLGVWVRLMLRGQRKGNKAEDDLQAEVVYARNSVSAAAVIHP